MTSTWREIYWGLYCVRMNLDYTKLWPTCPQFHVVITFLCINSSPSEEILWRHSRTFWTGQLCASPSWGQSRTSLLLIEIKMKFIISMIMFYMLTPANTSTITATPTTPPGRELIWITSLIQQNICNLFVYFFPRRPEQAYSTAEIVITNIPPLCTLYDVTRIWHEWN